MRKSKTDLTLQYISFVRESIRLHADAALVLALLKEGRVEEAKAKLEEMRRFKG